MEQKVQVVHSVECRENFSDTILEEVSRKRMMNRLDYKKDLSSFMIKYSIRRTLPYGLWTCESGRVVVFNREYQPILQRVDGQNEYADSNEWINDIVKVEYLYNDYNAPFDYIHQGKGVILTKQERTDCEKSLMICISILKEYTPTESCSVNRYYSIVGRF